MVPRPPRLGMAHAWVISGLLFAAVVAYAVLYHFRFPYLDHLDLAWYLDRYYRGESVLPYVFTPHAHSHWHAGARALLIPVAILSGWNTLFDVLISLGMALLAWVLLVRRVGATACEAGGPAFRSWATVWAAFFVFGLNQACNWLWGWQTAVFQNLLGVVAGVLWLTAPRVTPLHVLGAVAGGLLATYNVSTGLAFWPVAGLLVLVHPALSLRRRLAYAAVLLAVGAAVGIHSYCAIYAATERPVSRPLVDQVAFCLKYLGSPIMRFNSDYTMVGGAGAVGVVAVGGLVWLLGVRRRVPVRPLLPWIGFALYAVGAAVLTSFGREYRADAPPGAQYVSFANLLWISVFVLGAMALPRLSAPSGRWAVRIAAMTILVFACMNALRISGRYAKYSREADAHTAAILATYPEVPEAVLKEVFPHTDRARRYLMMMHERRINLFRP